LSISINHALVVDAEVQLRRVKIVEKERIWNCIEAWNKEPAPCRFATSSAKNKNGLPASA